MISRHVGIPRELVHRRHGVAAFGLLQRCRRWRASLRQPEVHHVTESLGRDLEMVAGLLRELLQLGELRLQLAFSRSLEFVSRGLRALGGRLRLRGLDRKGQLLRALPRDPVREGQRKAALDHVGEGSKLLVDAHALFHEGREHRVLGPLRVDEVAASNLRVRLEHSIDATVALLHAARVPRQVEVKEVGALGLQVHAFAGRIGADQDPGWVGGVVERLLDLLPRLFVHPAVQDEEPLLGPIRPGERRFELVNQIVLGVRVLGEDEDGPLEEDPLLPLAGRREKARRCPLP